MGSKPTYEELIQRVDDLERETIKRKRAEELLKESEEKYRHLSEGAFEAVVWHDQGKIIEANEQYYKMFGYTPEELAGKDALSLTATADSVKSMREQISLGHLGPYEVVGMKKDGTEFPMEIRVKKMQYKGKTARMAAIRDVTAQKLAEQALQKSNELLDSILSASGVGIAYAEDRKIMRANEAMANIFGFASPEDYLEKDTRILYASEEEYRRVGSLIYKTVPGKVIETDGRFRRQDDSTEFFGQIKVNILDPKDPIKGIIVNIIDITERKRIEAELLKEKDFSDSVLNSLPGILSLFDEDGKIIRWNNNLQEVSGYAAAEIRDMKPTDFFLGQEKDLVAETIREVIAVGKAHAEASLVTKNKRKIPYCFTGFQMVIDGKKYVLAVGVDISIQKQAEDKLRESEKRYRAVVEDIPAMICRFKQDGTFTFVNSSYCKYLNRKPEELHDKNFFQYIPEEEQDIVREHLRSLDQTMPIRTYEHQGILPDGSRSWMEWTGRALFDEKGQVAEYQAIGRDITVIKLAQEERVRIQKHLQQAQKMEAIGTLAGGIAHDFNNILGVIIGYAGMMQAFDAPEDSSMMAKIREVLKAANRAKGLVEQILTFSRRTEQERKPVRLDYIVKEALRFLRSSLPTTIEIHQNVADEEFIALADPTQMHQVLMNLCTNASHAMLETGGQLEVKLSALDLDAQSAQQFPELKPGPHLKLTVSDTGHGMTPKVMERIFDPFFTTKKPGEGTGMGLAVVHGIVKSHEGVIIVDSQLGRGTAFQVIIPRIEMGAIEPSIETDLSMPTGTQRILFVDDEEMLVDIGKKMLERLGYQVTTETNSRDALEVFRSQPDWFDLVITDQTMPYMTGIELAREMTKIRSNIPVILCTGYSEMATPERVGAAGISELMHKPLNLTGLAQTVRKVLGMKRGRP